MTGELEIPLEAQGVSIFGANNLQATGGEGSDVLVEIELVALA